MVFEGVNGAFGSIATMDVWWDQLMVHIFSNQKIFEGL